MTFTPAFWDDRKTHIIHIDQTRILQFNTWEVRAKSFYSTCSKEPFITQTYELHPVSHPIWNPVIKPSQVEIIISTAELKKGTLFRWKKSGKSDWLLRKRLIFIERKRRRLILTPESVWCTGGCTATSWVEMFHTGAEETWQTAFSQLVRSCCCCHHVQSRSWSTEWRMIIWQGTD